MKQDAYKQAGVDIDAGNELVNRIKPHVKRTKRSGLMGNIGGFGALFDLKDSGYKDPILVSGTDGVGTKLKVAIESGIHHTVGIDLVAMCVNDLIVQGAEPLFFLDYFATGKLEVEQGEQIVGGIAEGCVQSGCALIGGETAEMPGMYAAEDYDLAGFTVGAVERDDIITGENVAAGDVVLGLGASGVHSNGFSLVRKCVSDAGLTFKDAAPFAEGKSMGEALLEPTKIYVKSLLAVLREQKGAIKGMAHITGGGFTENIPRVLPENVGVKIDAAAWEFLPVFKWLKNVACLSNEDMARTFNCGIGMAVVVDAASKDAVMATLKAHGETVYEIGTTTAFDGTGEQVQIDNMDQAW